MVVYPCASQDLEKKAIKGAASINTKPLKAPCTGLALTQQLVRQWLLPKPLKQML
jgi:hypothetical protein